MMPEPCRTEPLTINEAMASSVASSRMVRRMEEPGPRPRLLVAGASGPLRRSTYRAPIAQRLLVLAATLALAATGTLQAVGLATIL
ncbi:hypothetical protein [Naasia sp. SYSU D00948]|uniref:hypothetical protein n=1 Tax=Naasia sp. SYSU D00948 TaxID=2817379 RepID=UPI001B305B21|nr:hypothetical protein [Naasia sp. SYSU D00948]